MPAKKQTSNPDNETSSLNLAQKLLSISRELAGTKKTGILPSNLGGKPYYKDEDISNALRPLLIQYGVLFLPNVGDGTFNDGISRISLSMRIINAENYGDEFIIGMEGIGTEIRNEKTGFGGTSMKKAITSATRYLYMKLFNLSDWVDDEQEASESATVQSDTPYGNIVSTNKNPVAVKQTAKNGDDKPKEERPFTPDRVKSGYIKMKQKDARPVDKKTLDSIGGMFSVLVQGDKLRVQVLKDFFEIHSAKDVTFGGVQWLQSWIDAKQQTDGSVLVNHFTQSEFLAIEEYMIQQLEEKEG